MVCSSIKRDYWSQIRWYFFCNKLQSSSATSVTGFICVCICIFILAHFDPNFGITQVFFGRFEKCRHSFLGRGFHHKMVFLCIKIRNIKGVTCNCALVALLLKLNSFHRSSFSAEILVNTLWGLKCWLFNFGVLKFSFFAKPFIHNQNAVVKVVCSLLNFLKCTISNLQRL